MICQVTLLQYIRDKEILSLYLDSRKIGDVKKNSKLTMFSIIIELHYAEQKYTDTWIIALHS